MIRRHFLYGAAASLFYGIGHASAQPIDGTADDVELSEPMVALPEELGFHPGFSSPDYVPNTDHGSVVPPALYTEIANTLLRMAPVNCRPIDVAEYFYAIGRQQASPELMAALKPAFDAHPGELPFDAKTVSYFVYDWQKNDTYFNPLVVHFLKEMHYKFANTLVGDDSVPWCASFMNWCLARSRTTARGDITFAPARYSEVGTNSSSSGSFTCYGERTQTPQCGDIVVFADNDTLPRACPPSGRLTAKGHVAFFTGDTKVSSKTGLTMYELLGGNQNDRGRTAGLAPAAAVKGANLEQQGITKAYWSTLLPEPSPGKTLTSFQTRDFLR